MAKELRKTILEYDDLKTEVVTVPEWGDTKIMVRSLDARQRARVIQASMKGDGQVSYERWQVELFIASACDPSDGSQLFEAADRDALLKKNSGALSRVTDVAQELSGLAESAVEEAKENFVATPSDDSSLS